MPCSRTSPGRCCRTWRASSTFRAPPCPPPRPASSQGSTPPRGRSSLRRPSSLGPTAWPHARRASWSPGPAPPCTGPRTSSPPPPPTSSTSARTWAPRTSSSCVGTSSSPPASRASPRLLRLRRARDWTGSPWFRRSTRPSSTASSTAGTGSASPRGTTSPGASPRSWGSRTSASCSRQPEVPGCPCLSSRRSSTVSSRQRPRAARVWTGPPSGWPRRRTRAWT
mmetsp:Transcript_2812/g.9747  ORF Transcript_2812/g.9747 Transcript_2812/m.9747 type:complete len:224 (+) Transcript_2812:166-837(+)